VVERAVRADDNGALIGVGVLIARIRLRCFNARFIELHSATQARGRTAIFKHPRCIYLK
jgi:hypothetical protein